MSRRKTTVYLDSDVELTDRILIATTVLAAAHARSESQVVEDALRAYLRSAESAKAGDDLRALVDRVSQSDVLDDQSAMDLALAEVSAQRAARRSTPAS